MVMVAIALSVRHGNYAHEPWLLTGVYLCGSLTVGLTSPTDSYLTICVTILARSGTLIHPSVLLTQNMHEQRTDTAVM